jgi:hypothetical protein
MANAMALESYSPIATVCTLQSCVRYAGVALGARDRAMGEHSPGRPWRDW